MSLTVDPEILRAFAGQVDTTSVLIGEAKVGDRASTAADGLPGSTTQWAARLVGAHVGEKATAITENTTRMATAVRGTGGTYEVTDAGLAGNFTRIF